VLSAFFLAGWLALTGWLGWAGLGRAGLGQAGPGRGGLGSGWLAGRLAGWTSGVTGQSHVLEMVRDLAQEQCDPMLAWAWSGLFIKRALASAFFIYVCVPNCGVLHEKLSPWLGLINGKRIHKHNVGQHSQRKDEGHQGNTWNTVCL